MVSWQALGFLDALPPELLPHLFTFLSGFELLALSHVDKRFYGELLGANSAFWVTHAPRAMRIGPYEWRELATHGWGRVRSLGRFRADSVQRRLERNARREQERSERALELSRDAKRHYFASVSLQFPGLNMKDAGSHRARRHRVSGRVCLHHQQVDLGETWASESFSFDLWLALLPPASSQGVVGGVVFSAESSNAHAVIENFVHVDPHGGLYCSVADGDKYVVATLSLWRWYHVALTFDHCKGMQSVYLDGKCIDLRQGGVALPEYWTQLAQFQLGTGYVDERCVGGPERESDSGLRWISTKIQRLRWRGRHFCGYYSFNGLLDAFRLWRGVLTPRDVEKLSQGREDFAQDRVKCSWSLMVNGDYRCFLGELWAVQCTRPSERMCLDVCPAFCVWGRDQR